MIELILFILCAIVIITSGNFLIRNSVKVSRFFGLSEFEIRDILITLCLSLPVITLFGSAVFLKYNNIALGILITTSAINFLLIPGIHILRGKRRIKRAELIFSCIILLLLFINPAGIGILLIFTFIFYLLYSYKKIGKGKRHIFIKYHPISNFIIGLSLFNLIFCSYLLIATFPFSILGINSILFSILASFIILIPNVLSTRRFYDLTPLFSSNVTTLSILPAIFSFELPSKLSSFSNQITIMLIFLILLLIYTTQRKEIGRYFGSILLIGYVLFLISLII